MKKYAIGIIKQERFSYLLVKQRANSGFSLIELQIANLLGLLLGLMLFTTFSWLLHQYKRVRASNEIQLNALLANEVLHKQLSMAGFIGCPSIKDITIKSQQVNFKPSLANSILGFSTGSPAARAYSLPKAKLNSDIIVCWFRATKSRRESTYFSHTGLMLLSTCRWAELMPYEPKRAWPQKVDVAPFHLYAFYLRACKSSSSSCYGLFRKPLIPLHAPAQEIVSGIHAMKISYGMKSPGGELQFKPAASVNNWARVSVVKVELLFKSSEPVLTQPQRYWFHGRWHVAADRFLYRSTLSYVYLRQR